MRFSVFRDNDSLQHQLLIAPIDQPLLNDHSLRVQQLLLIISNDSFEVVRSYIVHKYLPTKITVIRQLKRAVGASNLLNIIIGVKYL